MNNEDARKKIADKCDEIKVKLLEKNKAYGNSVLDPVRIFSQADFTEQLKVRIDDKLSRIKRGQAAGEDVKFDLVGYLILLIIAEEEEPTNLVNGECQCGDCLSGRQK